MAEKKKTSRMEGMRTEARKVQWPTKEQTIQYTGIVLLIAAVVALAAWGLDLVFSWLMGLVL